MKKQIPKVFLSVTIVAIVLLFSSCVTVKVYPVKVITDHQQQQQTDSLTNYWF